MNIEIRDMQDKDVYYVSTCTHIDEDEECDRAGISRADYFRRMYDKGLRIKVVLSDGEHVGFIYYMPIEVNPWGPIGEDMIVIPCLVVTEAYKRNGIGKALVQAAEEETQKQGKKALISIGYRSDIWFMPAGFFESIGFEEIKSRKLDWGEEVIFWKVFDDSVSPPEFLKSNYNFKPIEGKVVVDLFWNNFCQTSTIEADRVKRVVREFGDDVILNEYSADDRDTLLEYQIPRAIYVNGKEIYWGYEAPEEGICKAITEELTQDTE